MNPGRMYTWDWWVWLIFVLLLCFYPAIYDEWKRRR